MAKSRFGIVNLVVLDQPLSRRLIATKFIRPTNTRDACIKVTSGRISKTYRWDHGLDVFSNHAAAARMLQQHMKWDGRLVAGGAKEGYVFVPLLLNRH